MPKASIINADVLDGLRGLEPGSVQCIITSPPYWGLRDYGTGSWVGGDPECDHDRVPARGGRGGSGAPGKQTENAYPSDFPAPVCSCGAHRVDLQIGLEQSPDEYVNRMVEVFREARRVLRDDGVLWLNLGDSYASSATGSLGASSGLEGGKKTQQEATKRPEKKVAGFTDKNLIGIPWRVAFALQSDGWCLRSDIIWAKPNPMPESVQDRPTSSHEYVFLFVKQKRYFYDNEAVKEAAVTADPRPAAGPGQATIGGRPGSRLRVPSGWDTGPGSHQGKTGRYKPDPSKKQDALGKQTYTGFNDRCKESGGFEKRNLRTVWSIPTQPFPDAHFATFPQQLVVPMIKAGTSEKGKCSACGAPWKRVTEYFEKPTHSGSDWREKREKQMAKGQTGGAGGQGGMRPDGSVGHGAAKETIGWEPTCECGTDDVQPCVVLDPFSGSGTTGLVACKLGRDYIGIELSPEYATMARRRIYNDAPLFNEVE